MSETNDLLSCDTDINTTEDCDSAAGCRSESEKGKRAYCIHTYCLVFFFFSSKNSTETLFMEIISQCSFIYLELLVNM